MAQAEEEDACSKQFLAQSSEVIIQPLHCKVHSCTTTASTTTCSSSNSCSNTGSSSTTDAANLSKDSETETDSKMAEVAIAIKSTLNTNDLPPSVSVSHEVDFVARRAMLRYKCDVCGRECPSKHKLKRHLSTHSEARPFPCRICGRTFKWTEYLQKHIRQQHAKDTKGKGYQSGESLLMVMISNQYSKMYVYTLSICTSSDPPHPPHPLVS